MGIKNDYNIGVDAVSGALYESLEIDNKKIIVAFTEVGSGLITAYKHLLYGAIMVDDPLKTFEIKDQSCERKPAQAKIISKIQIEVWNNLLRQPVNVCYAWSGTPSGANFYNKKGLPAAVFITEK